MHVIATKSRSIFIYSLGFVAWVFGFCLVVELLAAFSHYPKIYFQLWAESGVPLWKIVGVHFFLGSVVYGLSWLQAATGPSSDAETQANAIIAAIDYDTRSW